MRFKNQQSSGNFQKKSICKIITKITNYCTINCSCWDQRATLTNSNEFYAFITVFYGKCQHVAAAGSSAVVEDNLRIHEYWTSLQHFEVFFFFLSNWKYARRNNIDAYACILSYCCCRRHCSLLIAFDFWFYDNWIASITISHSRDLYWCL